MFDGKWIMELVADYIKQNVLIILEEKGEGGERFRISR